MKKEAKNIAATDAHILSLALGLFSQMSRREPLSATYLHLGF